MVSTRQFTVASVVVVLAVTPTLWDGQQWWESKPEQRWVIGLWYLFVVYVALAAWRIFAGNG